MVLETFRDEGRAGEPFGLDVAGQDDADLVLEDVAFLALRLAGGKAADVAPNEVRDGLQSGSSCSRVRKMVTAVTSRSPVRTSE
jgi:hypothetical protein